MHVKFDLIGTLFGILGIALCAVAGGARLGGAYHLLGFEVGTLFDAGVALLVLATLAKVQALLLARSGH